MVEFKSFLEPSEYIDAYDPRIIRQANLLTGNNPGQFTALDRFFLFVRDQVLYYPPARPAKASDTLVYGVGNDAGKACLLAAFCRIAGIPAGVSVQEVQDMKMMIPGDEHAPEGHVITNVFIDGRWLKLDASMDRWFARGRNCTTPRFDGIHDALLPEIDRNREENYRILDNSRIYVDISECPDHVNI